MQHVIILFSHLLCYHFPDAGYNLGWESPQTEMLVDHLAFRQHWEPSYVRQRLIPMLSTIYLRDMASDPTDNLLYGQYEFHNIQRIKMRYGHRFFVINWKKDAPVLSDAVYEIPEGSGVNDVSEELDESHDMLEEIDAPSIHTDNGCTFLSTDEDMTLVQKAFPEKTSQFLKEKVRTVCLCVRKNGNISTF